MMHSKKLLGGLVALPLLLNSCFTGPSAKEWAQMKEDYFNRTPRVMIDNDGSDALRYPAAMKPSVDGFYSRKLNLLLGKKFNVEVYTPGTVGFAVTNRSLLADRMLNAPQDNNLQNITAYLEQELNTDPVQLALEFSRAHDYEFFLNMHANDCRDAEHPEWTPEFRSNYPEFLCGTEDEPPLLGMWNAYDFACSEVRKRFVTCVTEWFEKYDPDGFLLDFNRTPFLFRSVCCGGMPNEEEMEDLTKMLKTLRKKAEKIGRRRGRPIFFAFRMPDSSMLCNLMGADVEKWMEDGLFDIFIAGSDNGHYTPYRMTRVLCNRYGIRFYASIDKSLTTSSDDNDVFNRNTVQAINGRIASAYACGAEGIYLFNVVENRDQMKRIQVKPKNLVREDKTYFLTVHSPVTLNASQPQAGTNTLLSTLGPKDIQFFAPGELKPFHIELGDDFRHMDPLFTRPNAKLYFKSNAPEDSPFQIVFNDVPLECVDIQNQTACYVIPLDRIKHGLNKIAAVAPEIGYCPESEMERFRESHPELDLRPITPTTILKGDALVDKDDATWQRLFAGNSLHDDAESIMNGAYRLSAQEDAPVNLLLPLPGVKENNCFATLSFECAVSSDTLRGGAVLRIANGWATEVIEFTPDKIRLRHADAEYDFDTQHFHAYHLIFSKSRLVLTADGANIFIQDYEKTANSEKTAMVDYEREIPLMQDQSILIGSLDKGVRGTSFWKNLILEHHAICAEDCAITIEFPKD